ncbi:hypothetical protein IB223_16320 [Pseudoxanthomonas sp. PXM03]|uniref:hypothetical protein n=1 Tax=Pseudoxanthomonas sp. PXM03 TaxID=2769284 RepID=UPI00177B07B1|nr:hypothetical protein [Pseudoxanthomonas sp. PXM03]MBD9437663.1 hypothetical protein [Pseudoxanthomonas sp. PXM03]
MKNSLAKPLALTLNILGAGLLFYGLRQINNCYERVYEIASTGSSSVGAKIGDFPSSITLYFGVLLAAGLYWWIADKVKQRDAV